MIINIDRNIDDNIDINDINDIDDYFIIYNGKLLQKNKGILNFINNNQNIKNININNLKFNNIEIIARQRGGGGLLDIFTSIIKIGDLFVMLGRGIEWLIKFTVWFLKFLMWLFIDLLNPLTLATEFFKSLMVIVITILRLPFDLLIALFAIFINTIGGWMQGFWGWDQSRLTKSDKESNYFKEINRNKGTKYYLTNSNTVPFSVILGTILCPPMGVFMEMGTSGWINIIICALLTLTFYVPGLFYALLIIYS